MTLQTAHTDTPTVGIQPPYYRLPDTAHVGIVTLAVSNLAQSVAFYHEVIGLAILQQGDNTAELGVEGNVLLKLFELPGVSPIRYRTRLGLYHTAFLLPNRAALGSFIEHLNQVGANFGAGDHIYSEALYLVDPDGLSVEVYADRPRSVWKTRGQELLSATEPVDIGGVLSVSAGTWNGAPAGTTIGHVHLYIGDLDKAARFYHQGLGLAVMTWSYPGALFVSAGGYHHHVGLNVWAAGSPPATAEDARLLSWELLVPNQEEIEKIEKNLTNQGWITQKQEDGTLAAIDPWGIKVLVTTR